MGHLMDCNVSQHGQGKTDGMLNKKGEKCLPGVLMTEQMLCSRYSVSAKDYGECPFVSYGCLLS